MNEFKNNKYAIKLEEESKKENPNLKLCKKLREKASQLRKRKSLELMKFINSSKALNSKKDFEFLNKLISTGADINYFIPEGITPYMLAAINGQTMVLDFLKENGADINRVNLHGQDAYMLTLLASKMARFKNLPSHRDVDYMSSIRLLRQHGLDLSMHCDYMGNTLDDYITGELEPFTEQLMLNIKKYLRKENYELNAVENLEMNF